MIVWINGVTGVGKSHVAKELAKQLSDKNVEYLESDLYWIEFLKSNSSQNDIIKAYSGFYPYYNKYFLSMFRNVLEKNMKDLGKMPIVSMSLVTELCERGLLDYFKNKKNDMFHIILEAQEETIISRIENDPIRDESAQRQQKSNVSWQIVYLENKYPDAVRINTEDKTIDEIVGDILTLMQYE